MKKTILFLLSAFLLLQMVGIFAFAQESEQTSDLTVVYKEGELLFADLEISIYRVADIGVDGSYTLCGNFADYPVNVKVVRTQEEWRTIATTLTSYIIADGVSAMATETTDEKGEVVFEDLAKGLYLVFGVQTEKDNLVYSFESFFSSLPRPDENGIPQYEVKALPKHTTRVPESDEVEYKVLKQWKDEGYNKRPTTVEVGIYDDGELVSTQTLSAENNWSYSWKGIDDGSVWTVVERNIPDEYTVTVTENETAFVITNSYTTPTPPPPTGDVSVTWHYVLALFSAGAILLILSFGIKRARNG